MKLTRFLFLSSILAFVAPSDIFCQWIKTSVPNCNWPTITTGGPIMYAGTDNAGVFRSTDSGITWLEGNSGLNNNDVRGIAFLGHYVFVGTIGGGVFRSVDSEVNWATMNNGLTNDTIQSLFTFNSALFVATSAGLFRSNDSGISWVSAPMGKSTILVCWLCSGSKIFAGTANGLFLSTDTGSTWRLLNSGMPTPPARIWALASQGSNFFAATRNGIFRSTDTGLNWIKASSGLSTSTFAGDSQVYSLAASDSYLFAGMSSTMGSNGVLKSTDNGNIWTPVGTGLPHNGIGIGISSLCIFGSDLFAGGIYDAGVYRRPLSEMIGTNAVAPTPSPAQTLTAYPNPSTQSATISFTSPEIGEAEITIVNLLGEEVARLFEGTLEAGAHTFTWDGRGVAPGVYECIVRVGGSVERVGVMRLP